MACAEWKGPLFVNRSFSHTCTWVIISVWCHHQGWQTTISYAHSAVSSFLGWLFMHILSGLVTDYIQKVFLDFITVYLRPQLLLHWFDQSLPLCLIVNEFHVTRETDLSLSLNALSRELKWPLSPPELHWIRRLLS